MKQDNKKTTIFNYPAKKYSSNVYRDTTKYQKQYGFEIGKGEHATWNNEADAFKHAYMQAQLALWGGKHIAKVLGDKHERDGNKTMGQTKEEENMDQWNNIKGREIAKEIIHEYGPFATMPSQKINDIIAKKVYEKMQKGELITKPFEDKRSYKDLQSGQTTNSEPKPHIYTREEIGKMSTDEFAKHEKAIMKQMKEKGIPTKRELEEHQRKTLNKNSSSNNTDGRWVTINGNHVLINK